MNIDLNKIKSIHFTGIKGVGMTALALCAQDLNIKVTGSDTDETFPTSQILKKRKFKIKIGFNPKNIPQDCDLLIYTGAHNGSSNPEVISAQQQNIPVLSHAQALALFSQNKKTIAVAGVGGKSSTSAMLAVVLEKAGFKPSFAVGVGNIPAIHTPGKFNKKTDLFVIESDEFVADPSKDLTPRFHYLNPYIAIITNLEHDHPDVYPTLKHVFKSFKTFVSKVDEHGAVIVNIDNPRIQQFVKTLDRQVITYGFSPQADWQIIKNHLADQKQFFTLKYKDFTFPEIILNVPGKFNILNATAAIAASHFLGVSMEKIHQGIKAFTGTLRRFEYIGQTDNILFYDDYAHHPIEIKALLKAVKDWFPNKRLIAIFQSHTYSRTHTFLSEFVHSFDLAHQVLINDIFSSARETDNLGLIGDKFTQAIQKHHPRTFYCPDQQATINYLLDHVQSEDVVFTIGAGNNFLWHKPIIKSLKNYKVLKKQLPNIKTNEPLNQHSTFKIGGPARYFFNAQSKQDLIKAVKLARQLKIQFIVLGNASNILISDKGFAGLVIKNSTDKIKINSGLSKTKQLSSVKPRFQTLKNKQTDEIFKLDYDQSQYPQISVTLDSGVSLAKAIGYLLKKNITGLEWFAGIPATIGGAVFMNIHGGKKFFSDYLIKAEILDEDNKVKTVSADYFNFNYDQSKLKQTKDIVLTVTLKLFQGPKKQAMKIAQAWTQFKSNQPQQSVGCIFQNLTSAQQRKLNLSTPSTGYVIDKFLHLKGKTIGQAKISEKHAGFIVNIGKAKADDVLKLIKLIKKIAKQKLDIDLKLEISLLGFD